MGWNGSRTSLGIESVEPPDQLKNGTRISSDFDFKDWLGFPGPRIATAARATSPDLSRRKYQVES
jgi:hypothetical protein